MISKSFLKSLFFLLLLFCSKQGIAQQTIDSSEREIVFQAVNVIPMDKEQVLENQVVVVKDGRIKAIGKAGKVKYSKDAFIVDGKGKYLMPGLAEMHAHVPPVNDVEPMKEVLRLFALNGITTIRGMLGHPLHLELRSQVEKGEVLGPRFYTSGPSFNGNSVKSPEQAEAMVREQKQAGYDFLKLHPGLTNENFAAIAKTAKEVNIPFAGHVSYDVGVWRAIESGYVSIDHLDGFIESLVPDIKNIPEKEVGLFAMYIADKADKSQIPKLLKALKENNIWVVPTEALAEHLMYRDKDAMDLMNAPEMKYIDKKTLGNWAKAKENLTSAPGYTDEASNHYKELRKQLILESSKQGVGLLLGSDAPQVFNVPGFSTHQELKYLVDAGLTPYQAITTGTVNVGKYLNRKDFGVLKPGAVADMILLSGNPLKDIENTQKIEGVMLGKQWLPEEYITEELKKLEKN